MTADSARRPLSRNGAARHDIVRTSIRLEHKRRRREALLAWLEHQIPQRAAAAAKGSAEDS